MDKATHEIGKLTSDLVKINSTSKGNRLPEIATFISDWLNDKGFKTKRMEFKKGLPIIISEAGAGKKSIMINGHMDVVPEGEKKKWKVDPYSGRIDKNGIYGRGTVDMKSGLAVLMYTFAEVAEQVDYKLLFSVFSDEELGGYNCARPFAKKYSPDFVLVAEPTHSELIMLGEKGVFQTKITAKGKTAHASTPSRGNNAIMYLAKDLERLSSISKRKISVPKAVRGMLNTSAQEFGNDIPTISFNAAIISGGLQPNVVPDYCEAYVDMRLPPGISVSEALKIERSMVKNSQVEEFISSEPSYTNPSNKYAVAFVKTAKKHVKSARTCIMSGGTDGRFFRYKGIPTITFGPGAMKFMHTYDEWVGFDELDATHRVYKDFLLNAPM